MQKRAQTLFLYSIARLCCKTKDIYDNTELVRCHEITNNILNYNKEDKLEILKSDLLFGLKDKEIENKITNTDLQIYDFLKGMN